jgi:hypothetical protein
MNEGMDALLEKRRDQAMAAVATDCRGRECHCQNKALKQT